MIFICKFQPTEQLILSASSVQYITCMTGSSAQYWILSKRICGEIGVFVDMITSTSVLALAIRIYLLDIYWFIFT
jgi:hypothetical protein